MINMPLSPEAGTQIFESRYIRGCADPEVDKVLGSVTPEVRATALEAHHYGAVSVQDLTNREIVQVLPEEKHVAAHETGHAMVAENEGHTVLSISIVPETGSRGRMHWKPNVFSRFTPEIAGSIARVCMGGHAGADSSDGCGSDFGKADLFAQLAGTSKSAAGSAANGVIGRRRFEHKLRTWELVRKKQIYN